MQVNDGKPLPVRRKQHREPPQPGKFGREPTRVDRNTKHGNTIDFLCLWKSRPGRGCKDQEVGTLFEHLGQRPTL